MSQGEGRTFQIFPMMMRHKARIKCNCHGTAFRGRFDKTLIFIFLRISFLNLASATDGPHFPHSPGVCVCVRGLW